MPSPQQLDSLPLQPGCYLFKDASGKILYVGKAKLLRKRVSSYFQKNDLDPKTKLLVSRIKDIDFIVTSNEVEAYLLENTLIKKHYPKFNIDLKDSRRYAYLKLAWDDFPWLEVARTRDEPGEYYGPFVSGAMRRLIQDTLSRQIRILTKKPSLQLRKSLNKEQYAKRVSQAKKILKGNVDELIEELQKEMSLSSSKQYYEHALSLRNQIHALETLKEKQHMELTRSIDAQVINYILSGQKVYLSLFSIRKGVLEGKQDFSFPYFEGFLNDFIVQYYDAAPIPQELILPEFVDETLALYLTQKRGKQVSILVPQRGEKKALLDLVLKNISATFFEGLDKLVALQKALELSFIPSRIECFDISHLSGTSTVASMVSFKDAKPDKSNYRKFKIQSLVEGDDFWAMQEVVRRRYAGSLKYSMSNPDLILIDGGLGQLGAAMTILRELNLKIPVIALAKKFEEIYIPGSPTPLALPHSHIGLQLLQAVRDEAHRFAITYNRLLRKKKLLEK